MYCKFRGNLRPPEDGNHLPKHVGINLEYINKTQWLLGAIVGHLQRHLLCHFTSLRCEGPWVYYRGAVYVRTGTVSLPASYIEVGLLVAVRPGGKERGIN
jgi:hypothetical protein